MTNIAKPLIKSAAATGFVVASMAIGGGVAAAEAMNWEAVAQCESGGNWAADTGNGAYGGLQFKQATWEAYGGTGNPAKASKQQQIAVANRVLVGQGPGAWPTCSRAGGLPPVSVAGLPQPARQLEQTIMSIIEMFIPNQ
ncbi:transglycosylase family protein [Mycobacterium sp.]|uniref:transglycosylase family protein n=1 Tax=Mycobacterium sp. TaxID=1785 RepID=UPI003A8ABE95